jgi:hypothetical protein
MAKFNTTDPRAHVHAIRATIADRKSQRDSLQSALVPQTDVKDRIAAYVERMANAADLSCRSFVEQPGFTTLFAGEGFAQSRENTVGLLCWLEPDRMRERLFAHAAKHYDDATIALSAAEVRAQAAALTAEILALEIEEERAIAKAAAVGVEVNRRVDADPRAVLAA